MTEAQSVPSTISGIDGLAGDHYVGASVRATEHSLTAERWTYIHRSLTVFAAVLSATAGGSLLGGAHGADTPLAATLALLAAAASAVDATLGASTMVTEHKKAADRFSAIASTIALFRRVQIKDGSEATVQQARYLKIMERREAATSDSPQVPSWAKEKARMRRQSRTKSEGKSDTAADNRK